MLLQRPARYCLLATGFLLSRVLWSVIPLERFDGYTLQGVALGSSLVLTFCRFTLFLLLYTWTSSLLRGEKPAVRPKEFLRRYKAALLPGVLAYLLFQLGGYLSYGLTLLLDHGIPAWKNQYNMSISWYLGALPVLYLLARYGFMIVGAGAGDQISPASSWRMTKPFAGPLFCTTLVWWVIKSLPTSPLCIHLFFKYDLSAFFFHWLQRPYQALTTVFFATCASVWYEKLRLAPLDAPDNTNL